MILSLDRLHGISATKAGQAALAALTRIDRLPPEEQVAGLAILFVTVMNKYGTNRDTALRVATNILDRGRHEQEVRALKAYAANEWKPKQ